MKDESHGFQAATDRSSEEVDAGMMLANADFASADDLFTATIQIDELYIPEIRKKVRVKALTGRERDAYEQSLVVGRGADQTVNMRNARAKLAVLSLVDAQGNRIYKDNDIGRIGSLPAIVLERIFDRARKLSGLTNRDMDELLGN